MEHMVEEMLEDGIIRPRQSYYSAPLVMIHMKYGSYYRDISHPFIASTIVATFIVIV